VDDSPVALAFLEAVFRGAHYEVETASNGMEGLDKALRSAPDLIVTDGLMPDVDGFELVRRLRNHPETASTAAGLRSPTRWWPSRCRSSR
jgi:CheY-like chemotaxis protein